MAEQNGYGVAETDLEWDEKGIPRSSRFNDRYFSADGGLDETRHVFLSGNGLPERWQSQPRFVIGELGFGTGLSFLSTYRAWRENARPGGALHYISFELHPIAMPSLRRALASFPSLADESALLLSRLPSPTAGFHRISFPDDVFLTLAYGDAAHLIERLEGRVDAWYLDGFAPDRNPELWSDVVVDAVARKSVRGTTAATYSAASAVRRRLVARGFSVEKLPGFGRKREMIRARFDAGPDESRASVPRDAIVVGGGLAGVCAAERLAARGCRVTLLERGNGVAQAASGNPAGVLMPHLSLVPDTLGRFYLSGYEHTLRLIRELRSTGSPLAGELCGVLRLASSERLQKLTDGAELLGLRDDIVRAVDAADAVELCGYRSPLPGLWYAHGGWVSPPDLCRSLLESSGVELRSSSAAHSFSRDGERWRVSASGGGELARADVLVLANAYDCMSFPPSSWLPLEKVRGQALRLSGLPGAPPRAVVCADGYAVPLAERELFIGASYDHDDDDETVREGQNEELLDRVRAVLPDLSLEGRRDGRVAFRTMSRDRLPLVGRVPVIADAERLFREKQSLSGACLPNLYLSVGHGSRGLISCPLAGELVASEAFGEPLPLESDLVQAVRAERFLERLLLRGASLDAESLSTLKVKRRAR